VTLISENANATIKCPVDPGQYQVTHTVKLPNEIPRGTLLFLLHFFSVIERTLLRSVTAKFVVQVRGYTEDERPMICLDIMVNFMFKFPHLDFFSSGDR
jgi:hypothetical protein